MKKTITLFVAILFYVSSFSQVPNGGLENWTDNNPTDWITSNVEPLSLFPITQSTDAYSGSFAARGEVISDTGSGELFPPILSSAVPIPVTEAPTTFSCWYKWNPPSETTRMGFSVTVLDEGDMLTGLATALVYTEATEYTLLELRFHTNWAIQILQPK